MTTDELFRRARLMVAQSSHPTTLREQLGKLSRRRNYGRVKVTPERQRENTRAMGDEVHDWQLRKDLQ